ncbi:MAG: hypothetical protein MZV70_04725 [Desulfobacterales bacterium]|nr:hypothetical protein [Desulfobacterales bacterium]
MNEEGGLAKTLFVMGVESGKKKRELAAQGKSCFKTNLKFKIADAIVFKKIREKLGGRLKELHDRKRHDESGNFSFFLGYGYPAL